jgi:hypothetical protein
MNGLTPNEVAGLQGVQRTMAQLRHDHSFDLSLVELRLINEIISDARFFVSHYSDQLPGSI